MKYVMCDTSYISHTYDSFLLHEDDCILPKLLSEFGAKYRGVKWNIFHLDE